MLDKNIVAAIQAATTVEAIYLAASVTLEAKYLVSEWKEFGDSDDGTKEAPKDFSALWDAATEYSEIARAAVRRLHHKQNFDYILENGPLEPIDSSLSNLVCAFNTILMNNGIKFEWVNDRTQIKFDDGTLTIYFSSNDEIIVYKNCIPQGIDEMKSNDRYGYSNNNEDHFVTLMDIIEVVQ